MATLKVTIKEELVLNGKDVGNSNYIAIAGVNNAEHRVVTLPNNSEQSILLFDATAVSAGTIVDNTLRYLRFTNLDASNNIQLRISEGSGTSQQQYAVVVEPGESYILGNDDMYGESTSVTDNPTALIDTAVNAALANIDAIYAMAVGADCELEMFLATT
jgi:hypothetical protein